MIEVCRRWETSQRYYEARIYCDLFGEKVLETVNGGLNTRLGMTRVVAAGDEIPAALAQIDRRRLGHGYTEVSAAASSRPGANVVENAGITHSLQWVSADEVLRELFEFRVGVVQDDEFLDPGTFDKLCYRIFTADLAAGA